MVKLIRAKDLRPGMIMGHFKLIKRVRPNPNANSMTKVKWRAQCMACPKEHQPSLHTIPANYFIRQPNPKEHCGCMRKTLRTTQNREYRIWIMMRVRTSDPRHVAYKDYGGRGIKVCPEWFEWKTGFEAFFAHVGAAPTPKHQIDRKDNDKGYEPGNVKWSTPKEQRANQRPYKNAKYKETANDKPKPKPETSNSGQSKPNTTPTVAKGNV